MDVGVRANWDHFFSKQLPWPWKGFISQTCNSMGLLFFMLFFFMNPLFLFPYTSNIFSSVHHLLQIVTRIGVGLALFACLDTTRAILFIWFSLKKGLIHAFKEISNARVRIQTVKNHKTFKKLNKLPYTNHPAQKNRPLMIFEYPLFALQNQFLSPSL